MLQSLELQSWPQLSYWTTTTNLTASAFSPSVCHEVKGPDAMILVFLFWVSSQFFHSVLWLFRPCSQGCGFSSSRVRMWELDHKEGWVLKNWCFCAGEDSWALPWVARRLNQSVLEGNQPWIFTGRTDAKAIILRPPDVKSWLIVKDPDARKDWS